MTMAQGSKDRADERRRKDLAEFLKARRATLKPSDFGLPNLGRRRAPGLRREELAQISGIGVSWYTSLEQGRDIQVSKKLLQRLVSALRLSPHDAAYLSSLADHPVLEVCEPSGEISEMLQVALDGFTAGPAFVTDEAFDVIAFNQLADFIYGFGKYDGPHAANIAWRLFMDPYRRGIFVAWREWATQSVGLLRAQCARYSSNAKLEQLVEDLLVASPEFAKMWDASRRSGAASYLPNGISFTIAGFGILNFLSLRLRMITNPDWLLVHLIPADENTADAVRRMRVGQETARLHVQT